MPKGRERNDDRTARPVLGAMSANLQVLHAKSPLVHKSHEGLHKRVTKNHYILLVSGHNISTEYGYTLAPMGRIVNTCSAGAGTPSIITLSALQCCAWHWVACTPLPSSLYHPISRPHPPHFHARRVWMVPATLIVFVRSTDINKVISIGFWALY